MLSQNIVSIVDLIKLGGTYTTWKFFVLKNPQYFEEVKIGKWTRYRTELNNKEIKKLFYEYKLVNWVNGSKKGVIIRRKLGKL